MDLHHLLATGVTVLTASRRLAHALRIAYATHAQQQSLTAWRTPVVLPWTTWLRQQWLDARARGKTNEPLRLLSPAQARLIWEQIVVSHPLAQGLLNPSAAARIAQRSWRRLHDYLIPIERLLEFDSEEAAALHAWSLEFMQRCASLRVMDEAQLIPWAWDGNLTPPEPIALVGFDAHTPALQRLITRWEGQGSIRSIAAPSPASDVVVVGWQDREAEIEAAARWAREHVEARQRSIAIIIADVATRHDEIRRRFEEVFAPSSRGLTDAIAPPPFIIAAPQPLAQFPLVDAALLCLHLVQGQCNSRVAGRVLRSPFLRAAEFERDVRARADARLRQEQRGRWDAIELERWAAVNECTQLEFAMREVTRLQRALPSRAAPSTWAEHFHALLRAFGWPGERTLSSVEQQTMVKFQGSLAELGSLDAVTAPLSLAQALRELGRLALDTPFEPETPAAAVTIIDPTTVAGMSFDAVWIAGLDATQLPAPINPDPLIPLALQRLAGIPESSADANFKHTRIRLERLLSSAPSIVLSWPRAEGDAELQMSPLLGLLPQGEVALPKADVSWQHAIFAARPALEVLADDRAPALQERVARGGARTLELQSLCAFRAQATLRLRAEPLARVSSGLEPADRGKLLHRVLESLWLELGDQARLLALDPMASRDCVRELAQLHAHQVIPSTTRARATLSRLAVEQVTQQVLMLLEIDRHRPPFTIRRAERDESYTIAGLQLRLQPDRIDQLASGCLIVDYKLGAANEPRDWLDVWPGRPRKPQLPLYALAHADELAGLAFAVLAPGAVEYRGWSNGVEIAPGIAPYPYGTRRVFDPPIDWQALLQRWQQSLSTLAMDYVRGESPVDPLPDACTYCHLSTFCRIHERDEVDPEEMGIEDE